ncbi:proton-coupled zinc antiporter SLC30A2 isoform X1 [Bombyx mori]|uniref:Zinc transporter 2-like n=2 Tax=Bombyx mori TaxID=7091 RepID=A0A8R2AIB9_BOMMO|nr:zinc transporter 2 isoform X1 [Bombyx mori]
MSDELEARMWDESGSRYESRSRDTFFESAFASSEHLDRAPLLAEETYSDVPVTSATEPEHCHWPQAEPPSAIPQLLTALVLCAFFMVCELIGGYLAGSLSVMSDAAHMLSDCGGFALALLAFHCAKRPPDVHMSYGYKRAEVLGAMVSVLLIWILTGVFVYVAAARLHSGEYTIEPDMMMIVSGCGVVFNVILALVLHGCASDIAHHHSHGGAACPGGGGRVPGGWGRRHKPAANGALLNGEYTMKDLSSAEANVVTTGTRNINLRAALIHVIGDLIQSCGVLLASVLIKLYPAAKFMDPVCTFVFSFLVLLTSARVVRDALGMLMQGVPKGFRYGACVAALRAAPGVRGVHSCHVWALSTHHTLLSAHVVVDDLADRDAVLSHCQRVARDFGVESATFQVERHSPAVESCVVCRSQPADRP